MQQQETKKILWSKLVKKLSSQFADGDNINIEAILYLIGFQELNRFDVKLKKDDKVNLIHIGVCKILEPYGYYSFLHLDKNGWPHFELREELPRLNSGEQTILMKNAIIEYFLSMKYIAHHNKVA